MSAAGMDAVEELTQKLGDETKDGILGENLSEIVQEVAKQEQKQDVDSKGATNEEKKQEIVDIKNKDSMEIEQEQEKTELQREMELFEAAEKDCDQVMQDVCVKVEPNDKKRAHEDSPQEGRKKRGRKATPKSSARKEEDDVCFVCFDGGDLVLCDQRSCPKAYHLSCIGRDEEFFRKKGNWLCGWHFCCGCNKKSSIRCHTCPKAYCANCVKQHGFLLLGRKKGLCEECIPLVKMIECNESVQPDGTPVDFNDQETYEYLYKEYWEHLKSKLSIILPELDNEGKFVNTTTSAADSDDEEGWSSESEAPAPDDEDVSPKRREKKTKVLNNLNEVKCTINKEQKEQDEDELDEEPEEEEDEGDAYRPTEFDGWASKELKSFLKHMNLNPDERLKPYVVNKLLWEHIKTNKLQNPRKKTIIRCDEYLEKLFGKKKITHRGMMKYMHYHFVKATTKKAQAAQEQAKETDDDAKGKLKKKSNVTKPDNNEFAAINQHNVNLVYLRRALLEDMLGDPQFEQKVVGTFVRIRVPGMINRNEMCYRIVQIVGIKQQAEEYKAGKKMTNTLLEIQNLQKREDVTVDQVSNQDFTEDECKRLRQSIRCSFIRAPTVGELEQKALLIREAKLNDWFESETLRLSALRDRANETGRKKELRECVEKLQKLGNADYRMKELSKAPTIEADPTMDPDYESSEEQTATVQTAGDTSDKSPGGEPKREKTRTEPTYTRQDSWGSHSSGKRDSFDRSLDKRDTYDRGGWEKRDNFDRGWDNDRQNGKQGESRHRIEVHAPPPPRHPPPVQMSPEMIEREKAWYYQDPTGTVQGPFSFEQLRKWSATGLFPNDLRIWRAGQTKEQGILLVDALHYPPAVPPPAFGAPVHADRSWEGRRSEWGNPSPRSDYNPSPRSDDNGWGSHRSPAAQGPPWSRSKKETPCKFFQKGKGYCRNGESCPFQH